MVVSSHFKYFLKRDELGPNFFSKSPCLRFDAYILSSAVMIIEFPVAACFEHVIRSSRTVVCGFGANGTYAVRSGERPITYTRTGKLGSLTPRAFLSTPEYHNNRSGGAPFNCIETAHD